MAASLRGIGILHRVKALELDLRQLGQPPGDTAPIRLALRGDDGKDGTVQSP